MGKLKKFIKQTLDLINQDESFIKGDDFEDYVDKRIFTNKYYRLIHRTSDYSQNKSRFQEKAKEPDFTYEIINSGKQFMVECKYRKDFYDGEVEWTKESQLRRYRAIAKKKRLPVYVAIGMGSPSNPSRLFIIPLKDAKYVSMYDYYLEKYECDPDEPLSPKELFNY
jgi:hypothetical protein